jgi:hypothetical protein
LARCHIEARRAFRRLLRAPAFLLSVVALLAIGIGGTAAVGTAAYDLLARPLPYASRRRKRCGMNESCAGGGDMLARPS